MNEQTRLERFQALVRQAEIETGMTIIAAVEMILPNGTPAQIQRLNIGGTTLDAQLVITPIAGWQPKPDGDNNP